MPRNTDDIVITTTTSSSGGVFFPREPSDAFAQGSFKLPSTRQARHLEELDKLVNAIYLHIKAVRTIGVETINTAEIARALHMPLRDVERAIPALKEKGVKVAA